MESSDRFGSDLGLIHEVAILGRKVGADRDFWKILSQDQGVFRRVVALVKGITLVTSDAQSEPSDTYRVTVDYSKTFYEMLDASKCNYMWEGITLEHFPHEARQPEEVEIGRAHV